ncbi:MAG: SPOR domain-containing protein, partial [Culicoidibacterales bacterium]
TGNRKSISVEICYSKSGGPKFDQAEKNAAKLIAELLKEHGFGIDRVKRHYDWSKKNCPERTMNIGWQRFLNMIQAELNPPIVTPTPGTGTTMYRVVTGSFSSKANADKRVSDLKAKGFDSFIDVYTK